MVDQCYIHSCCQLNLIYNVDYITIRDFKRIEKSALACQDCRFAIVSDRQVKALQKFKDREGWKKIKSFPGMGNYKLHIFFYVPPKRHTI